MKGPVLHKGVDQPRPEWFEETFAANGWTGTWRNGVYGWDDFYATTHEVLGCHAGWADIQVGGPGGEVHRIEVGDVVVIPAGLAHCKRGQREDFAVVGAYPGGVTPDMQEGDGDPSIALPLPDRNPVLGHGRGFVGG